jgi:hypothetical protein
LAGILGGSARRWTGGDARSAAIGRAHLVPRWLGGCDRSECVVPVCRLYRRSYDRGGLELLPYLEPDNHGELAHARLQLGLIALLRRVILAGKASTGG